MVIEETPEKLILNERKPLINKYGKLTPIYPCEKRGKHIYYYCICDCGNKCVVSKDSILCGNSKSCGCLRSELLKEKNKQNRSDKIGKVYGKVKILDFYNFYEKQYENGKYTKESQFLCECLVCGKLFVARSSHLTSGYTQSCDCVKSHGELSIINFLKEKNIPYKKEFTFQDLKDKKVLQFDFKISTSIDFFLIEYQGSQHFQKTNGFYNETIVKHDKMKKEYCFKNNIRLYEITYQDNCEEKLEKILKKEGLLNE